MNLNYLKVGLLAPLAGGLFACGEKKQEDPPAPPTASIKLSSTTFTTTGQATSRVLKLTATGRWAVTLTDAQKAWIEVVPASGSAADSVQNVTVKLKRNMEAGQRSADVKFTLLDGIDGANVSYKVSQGTDLYFERDSLAVLAIYNAWNGPNWEKPWDLTLPVTKWGFYTKSAITGQQVWNGVYVAKDAEEARRVQSLWWEETPGNMKGIIPEELGQLTYLGGFRLQGFVCDEGKQFKDFMPIFEKLTKLEKLWLLKGCVFNGSEVPASLAKMQGLTAFYIGDHDFVGYEEGFGSQKFAKLQGITIQSGPFKTPLSAKHYANMPGLILISLTGNEIPGEVPADLIAGRISLLGLELSMNHLVGAFPSSIRQSIVFENSDGLKEICPQKDGFGFSSGCED